MTRRQGIDIAVLTDHGPVAKDNPMQTIAHLIVFACSICWMTNYALAQVITREQVEANEIPEGGASLNLYEYGVDVVVSPDWTQRATVEVSSRQNGCLQIANLLAKVYDDNPDMDFFENRMLHTEFADVDGDQAKDLVVIGRRIEMEANEGQIQRAEVICYIYFADPVNLRFIPRYRRGSIEIGYHDENRKGRPRIVATVGRDALRAAEQESDGGIDLKVPISKDRFETASFKKILQADQAAGDVPDSYVGFLKVANLRLKIYDDSDNGFYYEDEFLHTDFVDVTGDGFTDIVVSGRVIYSGVVAADPQESEVVVFVYVYDPAKAGFRLGYRHATFDLSKGPSHKLN